MTLEEAFKQAIKAYWENDEDEDTIKPKTYNKEYFKARETEYLGDRVKKDEDEKGKKK